MYTTNSTSAVDRVAGTATYRHGSAGGLDVSGDELLLVAGTGVSDTESSATLTSELDVTVIADHHQPDDDIDIATTHAGHGPPTAPPSDMVNSVRRLARVKDTMESDDSDLDLDARHKELDEDKQDQKKEEEEEERQIGASPNQRFLKFDKNIGRGSFKTVFKGLDSETGVHVAWCELQVSVHIILYFEACLLLFSYKILAPRSRDF